MQPPTPEFCRELIERARRYGWTGDYIVNGLLSGTKMITPDTAHDLGDAFGTGPEVWMNLESAYRLSLVKRWATMVELASPERHSGVLTVAPYPPPSGTARPRTPS